MTGHTRADALAQAAVLSGIKPEVSIVDCGYKGVVIDGVKIAPPRAYDAASLADYAR